MGTRRIETSRAWGIIRRRECHRCGEQRFFRSSLGTDARDRMEPNCAWGTLEATWVTQNPRSD